MSDQERQEHRELIKRIVECEKQLETGFTKSGQALSIYQYHLISGLIHQAKNKLGLNQL